MHNSEGTFFLTLQHIFISHHLLLSTPMGGDNYIEFDWDTEVKPLLTHNASLILYLLSTTKTRDQLEH